MQITNSVVCDTSKGSIYKQIKPPLVDEHAYPLTGFVCWSAHVTHTYIHTYIHTRHTYIHTLLQSWGLNEECTRPLSPAGPLFWPTKISAVPLFSIAAASAVLTCDLIPSNHQRCRIY